ncbi:MAG: MBL fold metallo-hydrolase [Clostridia bacterium]|nr:MBL fold metallo-hydrolase [Clostridia bacterium]
MKKIFSLFLAALLLFSAVLGLTSCSKDEGETDETTAATTTGAAAPTGDLKLVENGTANFTIVYQSQSAPCLLDSIDTIKNIFSFKYDVTPSAISDSLHTKDDSKVEILLGQTKYDASATALSALGSNSYSISVSGNKIVVAASHIYLFPVAVDTLLDNLTLKNGVVSLARSFSFKSESYNALSVAADKKTDYTIVYDSSDPDAKTAANKIRLAFSDWGININSMDDGEPSEGKEILIGKTNRDLSYESEAYYKNGWIGTDDDGNIALTGNISCVSDKFAEYVTTLGTDGNVALLDSMLGIVAPKGYGNAPAYEGTGSVKVIDSFELSKSYYVIVSGASEGDFEDYTDVLMNAGFNRHSSSRANGNLFETWTDGYSILTMSHITYTDPATQDRYEGTSSIGKVNYMSIAIDCIDNSAIPTQDTDIKKITTEQITQVGTNCGFVLRLADGRFVVFDGGMQEHASDVYKIIKDQNVISGKPVIAAWMLTHGHGDHIGAPIKFISDYSSKVELQSFVHNLPGYDIYNGKNTAEIDPADVSAALLESSTTLYEKIEKLYPEAKIIVAHAGQKFEYGGIDIDILFTTENLYGKQMVDTNMSSVIYSVKGSSGRMIITGDQQEGGCAILNAIYGSELKCDLIQVAHHGYNGGDTDMYASMDADYAIWTNSYEAVISGNLHILSENVRNYFNYKSVTYNLIPSTEDTLADYIVLTENMTKSQLSKFNVTLTDTVVN